MVCPFCNHDETRVVDSRAAEVGTAIRRRRECELCARRFTTYERAVVVYSVRKRDGSVEPFDARKLRRGVEQALADRAVPEGSVDTLIGDMVQLVATREGEISTDELGLEVLNRLRDLDHVAYLRFASVYKEFQGVVDFERELAELDQKRR